MHRTMRLIGGIIAIALVLAMVQTAQAGEVSASSAANHRFAGKLVLYKSYDCETFYRMPDSRYEGYTFALYDQCTGQKLGSCQTGKMGTCSFDFYSESDTRLQVEFSGKHSLVSSLAAYGYDPHGAPYEFDFTYQSRLNNTRDPDLHGGCAAIWSQWPNSAWYCQ